MAITPEQAYLISKMSLLEGQSEIESASELIAIHEKAIAKHEELRTQLIYRRNRLEREAKEQVQC